MRCGQGSRQRASLEAGLEAVVGFYEGFFGSLAVVGGLAYLATSNLHEAVAYGLSTAIVFGPLAAGIKYYVAK